MVKISIVLSLYNGKKYIASTMQSILNQTFSDWEFIVVSEYENNDGSEIIVENYARLDPRIKVIKNEKHLGLAESLNVGIQQATGEYIARVDADDPSYAQRFEKQVRYLDSHQDVFLCGTLQRSVLPDRSYVQKVPTEAEELKAAMLFGCEISHCSVMFRRQVFIENNMQYDSDKLGEDYALWTSIMFEYKMVNLPEVLVDHRWGFDNISLEKGDALKKEVCETSASCFKKFGIEVSKEDYILLSGWRSKPEAYARYNTFEFLYKQKKLLTTLYEKNKEINLIDDKALKKIIFKRWNWVCDCAGIFYQQLPYSMFRKDSIEPKVSIVLPVFQSAYTLRETVDSILVQEFESWELIIVNEAENTDGSSELAEMYAFFDSRIRVINNSQRLGLAASLNVGIEHCSTDFVARIDADDLSNAKRIGAQYQYLRDNPKVGICQTYQHYFGGGMNDFIHRPPLNAEHMKAKLLFFCDACHSTVMFRKHIFEENNLWYSGEAALEDYDLWTRAIKVTPFVTLPEIYGEYRISKSNISWKKTIEIENDMIEIVARQLWENLDIQVSGNKRDILNGWNNTFVIADPLKKEQMLKDLKELLLKVWERNKEVKYYDNKSLLDVIAAKWRWSKYNEPWQGSKNAKTIEDAIELPLTAGRKAVNRIKVLFVRGYKIPAKIIQRVYLGAAGKVIALCRQDLSAHLLQQREIQTNHTDEIKKNVEMWTWERFQRTEKLLNEIKFQNMQIQNELAQIHYRQNLIPYKKGEKIRIVFLFQIASFWPSWDSFYHECLSEEKMDVKFVFLDETATEDAQMKTAKEFLEKSNIDYVDFEQFSFEEFKPHVMIMQTPYDNWHRQYAHWSVNFKAQGIRIIYIPYGIEISDTEDSHKLHFQTTVIDNCWRIYTFSDRMRKDYLKYSLNRNAVRAVGLPRFDGLYKKEQFIFDEEVRKKVKGRKVVLWKLHFPKEIIEHGQVYAVTPPLEEYINFAKHLRDYSNLFFIFMPHPRFQSQKIESKTKKKIKALFDIVESMENVFVDLRDDYRESLVNADFIMVDRSAVMVEAGAMGVPVLFLYNKAYDEPITEAIKPLVDSYYHGSSSQDMIAFLDMCISGEDMKKNDRKNAFEECIPFFDGKCGKRIKEDIIFDLENSVL